MSNYVCPRCHFKLWLPVVEFETTHLGLYDDARFPGRCLLVLKRHVEHLTDLDRESSCAFFEDGRRAASAITDVTSAVRVNYAVLGNTEAHLHLHLVPRFPGEPKADRPPWEDPRPRTPLEPESVIDLQDGLRDELGARG